MLNLVFLYRKLLEAIYTRKLRRRFVFWQYSTITDCFLAATLGSWLLFEWMFIKRAIPDSLTEDKKALEYVVNIRVMVVDHRIYVSIILAIMWERVALLFRITAFLGPMLKIFFAMMRTIAVFLILYLISIVSFSSVGVVLFIGMEPFDSLYNAMIFLFSSSLGEFDFTVFDQLVEGILYGHVFYVSFLIMELILLLNLLIAILSNTYAMLEQKGQALYS